LVTVRVNPGETLADIARSHNTDVGTLQKVNPSLGGNEPTPD
jgi:LysM repeat protein